MERNINISNPKVVRPISISSHVFREIPGATPETKYPLQLPGADFIHDYR
jgi:hypothetical protein